MEKFYIIKVYYSDTVNIRVNTEDRHKAETAALKFMADKKPNTIVDAFDTVLVDSGGSPIGYKAVIDKDGVTKRTKPKSIDKVFLVKTNCDKYGDYEEATEKVFINGARAEKYCLDYNKQMDNKVKNLVGELNLLKKMNIQEHRRQELEKAIDDLSQQQYAKIQEKEIS